MEGGHIYRVWLGKASWDTGMNWPETLEDEELLGDHSCFEEKTFELSPEVWVKCASLVHSERL